MRSHEAVSHPAAPVEPFMRPSRMRDYDVERHEPDPRGWALVNGAARR